MRRRNGDRFLPGRFVGEGKWEKGLLEVILMDEVLMGEIQGAVRSMHHK